MRSITGSTRLLAVIGRPVSHSLSPFIHNFLAERLGLDYAYMAFDIGPETLDSFVNSAKLLNMGGFNITMPLKELIIPLLDDLSGSARACGAVNTVVNKNGKLTGYNTDADGFALSLARLGFDFTGRAAVLGSGGAAKAVAWALMQKGMQVTMVSRKGMAMQGADICPWEELPDVPRDDPSVTLVANCTPLGMEAHPNFSNFGFLDGLNKTAWVYDLVYKPRETKLLRQASERGLRAIDGLTLLVAQAALAFALFTGEKEALELIDELREAAQARISGK